MKHDYVGDPWIGVDLDGTLAFYDEWRGYSHVGDPIEPMLRRVKQWLSEGKTVKIFTARVASVADPADVYATKVTIQDWCLKYIGVELEITAEKDWGMIELWDDRCIAIESNTGNILNTVRPTPPTDPNADPYEWTTREYGY